MRYRLGRATKGQLFQIYRFQASRWVLGGFVPGTDDRSVLDSASLGVSNDGRLAVAFITYDGVLRVLESADGGRSWVTLGAPARLSVPGVRIPLLNPAGGSRSSGASCATSESCQRQACRTTAGRAGREHSISKLLVAATAIASAVPSTPAAISGAFTERGRGR